MARDRRAPAPRRRSADAGLWRHLALNVQPKLRVSAPADPAEAEADRVADSVMRMPEHMVQRECAARSDSGSTCPSCEEETRIQRKPDGTASGGEAGYDFTHRLGTGTPLDADSRAFFEPRFGRDFGDVRVHAGAQADDATRSVSARAFTLGRDVVFAHGEYAPHAERGRSLLAHELTHVVQQRASAPRIQRSLSVDPTPPTDPQDPLSTTAPPAFKSLAFSEMGAIVHSLCDQFNVDSTGNVAASTPDACNDLDAVAGGTRPIGCCCLCTLTAPGSGPWSIHVTGIGGPRTEHVLGTPGGAFFLHPRTSSFEFGAWNVAGARGTEDPVVVAGHEMCGHGALIERGVHPTEVERVDTNVHDPTVRVENLIRAEQGLPGPDRALAAGPHRGESFGRITVRQFPFNVTSIASLPAPERDKIQLAKDFINANNTWVDLFGHSDLVGSAAAKLAVSQARADNMKTALTTGTRPVSASIAKTFSTGSAGAGSATVSGNRITHVEGRSDFDAIPGAAAGDLRRVDIVMPTRPAGAEVPNPGTPTAVNPVLPQSIGTFIGRRFFGNACDRLLTRSAWF